MHRKPFFLLPLALCLLPGLGAQHKIPDGFTPIFNGRDLSGWHVSTTNGHGTTPDWRVLNGVLTGTQNPRGKGGILLTDKRYKDFEIYLELRPDWGCDGGLFLRSDEDGRAYQVMLDYLPTGNVGGIYGEGLKDVKVALAEGWQTVWKRDDWNSMRVRMAGATPRIQVWLNEVNILDWADTANHAADGAGDGMIAVQVHAGNRWVDAGFHRFRNFAVKELE
jgi:hypothetical protein